MEQILHQDNKIIVGIDIESESVQISWFGDNLNEPETVSMQVGMDKFKIPFCLFYREEDKEYQIGQAAVECNQNDVKGIFIPSPYTLALQDKNICIENEMVSPILLLQVFLEKLVHMVESISNNKNITSIAYTAKDMDEKLIFIIKKASEIFSDKGVKLYFKSYEESYIAYLLNGPSDFYARDSVLLYFRKGCLDIYHVMMNKKYKPFKITLQKEQIDGFQAFDEALFCSDEEREQLDIHFYDTVKNLFGKALISSVFLTGDGFDKDWMQETLRFLCHGRRVFQGKNLFTKGICYYLLEETRGRNYSFDGCNRLFYKIRLPMWQDGNSKPYELYDGDGDWYEVSDRFYCLLDECDNISLEIYRDDDEFEKRVEVLELTGLPKRPSLATKLQVDIMMMNRDKLRISAKDLGLGEFYESTGKVWEKEIVL